MFLTQWFLSVLILMKALLLLFSRSVMSDSLLILWAVGFQAPLAMGFPRQEYWNGLPFPSPGDLDDPGIETTPHVSPALWEDSLLLEPLGKSAPLTAHFNSFFVISILLKTESGQIFF